MEAREVEMVTITEEEAITEEADDMSISEASVNVYPPFNISDVEREFINVMRYILLSLKWPTHPFGVDIVPPYDHPHKGLSCGMVAYIPLMATTRLAEGEAHLELKSMVT